MIKQLRPFHTQEVLNAMYAEPHNHHLYGRGHYLRVELTKVIAKEIVRYLELTTGADLSCGNGEILSAVPLEHRYFGDFAEGYEYQGPIEKTIQQIPHVGVFVCSETLEHVEDPPALLKAIRKKADALVLTTPIEKWDDALVEHYWAWDRKGIENMLTNEGWTVSSYNMFDSTVFNETYKYGMWCCT